MNFLQQFQALFQHERRGVAKLVVQNLDGTWEARTSSGNQVVRLQGHGYEVGQTVFYDVATRRILETAPNVQVVELQV